MICDNSTVEFLLAMLDGSKFANALRTNGKPCRIRLPDDMPARAALVEAHIQGAPSTLTFHADGFEPWQEDVQAVVLAGFCPASDGLCRSVAIDLDGSDHGVGGLADPIHAVRVLAERADNAGLSSGLVVARSRRGQGRHLFLMLPDPTSLLGAVIGVAALVAAAFKIAASDVEECGAPHSFRSANGQIARAGDAGAIELFPRSSSKPPYGWAIVLPGAGSFAPHGGGVIVDAFTDRPITLNRVPRCDADAWARLVEEARVLLPLELMSPGHRKPTTAVRNTEYPRNALDRIDPRTRAFIDGQSPEGKRNESAFAASANLLGCGMDEHEAERMILAGAAACGLPQREALSAFKSALRACAGKGVCI